MRLILQNIRLRFPAPISLLLICIIIGSSCSHVNVFMNEFIFSKWMILCLGSALILILFAIRDFKIKFSLNHYNLIIGAILICLFIYLLFKASQFVDVAILCIFCCFFITCILCSEYFDIQKAASLSFICSAGISTVVAIRQFFEGKELTGCYDNLVGFDITLILGVLSIVYILKECIPYNRYRLILYLLIALFSILVMMTKSRLAILSLMAGSIACFTNKKKNYFILIPVMILLSLFSYFDSNKSESTYGRGFILKTSASLLDSPNRILAGYGENGFRLNYMTRQSECLKIETDTSRQRASNINHPLNEFLLISIKYGVLASILILLLLGWILFNNETTPYARAIILVITIYSFFSYPLRYPVSWISLAVSFTSFLKAKKHSRTTKLAFRHSYVLLPIGIIIFVWAFNSINTNRDWKLAHTQAILGKKQESLINYDNLSKRMKSDDFIYNYSSYLHNLGQHTRAHALLSNIELVDYETTILSGKIKASMGQYDDALEDLQLAADMCPNRFLPLFEIYKIYEKTENKEGMRIYSNLIKNKQIKIPSRQIEHILRYVSEN